MNFQPDCILIHYAEIGLKGSNRGFFESKLVDNLEKSLRIQNVEFDSVERISGRVLVHLKDQMDKKKASKAVENVFGVANYSFALAIEKDLDKAKKAALDLIKTKDFNSFALDTTRSDKNFPLNSREVNEELGAYIQKNLDKEVDLDTPDQKVFCEIANPGIYLHLEKRQGPGGLPVSTAGKALVLLSGGIDSPVAAYLAAKRGIKPVYIHFHSYPYTDKKAIEKNRSIVKQLNNFTFGAELHLIPFSEIQEEVVKKVPEKYRIIFYRRIMMKIATAIAEEVRAKALVTGESIGQVASQTLENMQAIADPAGLPILRPLVGMDKLEIIRKAKEIGTYKTSTEEADDTCTRFMPTSPATRPSLEEIEKQEEKLDIERLVEKGVSSSEVERIDCLEC